MKWIKLFEGFNKDEYYQKINRVDFGVYQWGEDNSLNNRVDFDRKIMTNIGSLLNNGFKFDKLSMGSSMGSMSGRVNAMTISGKTTASLPIESILIIQLKDEWFLVRQLYHQPNESYNYYICDQRDGLVKLLKDKGIIK